MKTWSTMLLVLSLVSVLVEPVAHASAAGGPTVSLELNHSVIAVGQTIELTVNVAGVADLYGSSMDVYYDSAVLQPVVPSPLDAAAASWVVTQGATEFFANAPNSAGPPARQSLIVLRTGIQNGAGTAASPASGVMGKLQFTALASGSAAFTVVPSAAVPTIGNVGVQLVDRAGAAISFVAGTAVGLQIGVNAGLAITSPVEGAAVSTSDFSIQGTGNAGETVTITQDSVTASAVVGPNGAWSLDVTGVPDGAHTITVADSHNTVVAPRHFYVDTSSPQVTLDPVVPGPQMTITGTIVEANLNTSSVAVFMGELPAAGDYTSVTVTPTGTGTYSFTRTFSGLVPGPYKVRVTATDVANHTGHGEATFQIAAGTVALAFDQPAMAGYNPGDTATLTVSFGDVPPATTSITTEFTFDPNVFTFANASLGASLDFTGSVLNTNHSDMFLTAADSPTSGSVHVNLSNPFGVASGVNKIFSLRLKVKAGAAAGDTAVRFEAVTPGGPTSGVLLADGKGIAIPMAPGPYPAVVAHITNNGTIGGRVLLAGRTDHSGVLVSVVEMPGITATTNAAGDFLLPNNSLPENPSYTLLFTRESFLSMKVEKVPVTVNTTTDLKLKTDLLISLKPGNLTDNAISMDTVYLEDLGAMARAWGTRAPAAMQWNARADLNGNGEVSFDDLGLMAMYWAQSGASAPVPSPGMVLDYTVNYNKP